MTIADLVDVVAKVHVEGEPVTTQDLGFDELEDVQAMVQVWREAKMHADAARVVLQTAGVRLAELLGQGGAAAIGDTIVRYTVKQTERCIDPDLFIAYVTDRVHTGDLDLGDVVNANYVRKSWMPSPVRDTFFEKIDDDVPSLVLVPRDRAPKFLQGLRDGEVKAGKR